MSSRARFQLYRQRRRAARGAVVNAGPNAATPGGAKNSNSNNNNNNNSNNNNTPGAAGTTISSTARDWTIDPDTQGRRRAHRPALRLIRTLLGMLRGHWPSVGLALFTGALATAAGLCGPLATKVAFDYVVLDAPGPAGIPAWWPFTRERGALLWIIAVALVTLTILGALVAVVGRYALTRTTRLVQSRMRQRVFEHLTRLPLHRLQALKSGGASSILRDDAGAVGDLLFTLIYNPWRALLTLAGGLTAMAVLDWRMLVGGVLLLPAVWLSHRTWINRIRPVHRDVRHARTAADAQATEAFAGIRVVRAFGRQRGESARFVTNNHLMTRQEMLIWWWTRLVELLWTVLIPAASAGVIVYGGTQIIAGRLTVGDVTAFSGYLLMLLGPLELLVGTSAQLQNSLAGFDRCLDVLEEPTELGEAGAAAVSAAAAGGLIAPPRGRIDVEGVGFAYPGRSEEVLSDIDLTIPAGQTVALVGASGSGKTTLCNLVARFYDPTRGRVLLDGADLRTLPLAGYRRHVGIVEQEVFLFDGTIRDNIGYARRDADDAAIRAAARAAYADEFIERLDRGYDTLIGERGVRLSGGQKQRLAIARAILADPRVLILDEATSSLDSESERLIQQSLATLMRARTCLVIAHRLGTIRHADLIVVLDRGRIAERGTHEQLYAAQGRYRAMLEVQLHAARDYADHAHAGPRR